MSTKCEWEQHKKALNLTPIGENIIELEKSLIMAVVDFREKSGSTPKQSVIDHLGKAIQSEQVYDIIKILNPLGYKLAIVKIPEN